MKRVTEPELMNNRFQAEAYASADFSETDNQIVLNLELLLKEVRTKIDGKTLFVDLGCGPGNIAERIAMKWRSAHVLGIDGSEEMLSIAENRAEKLKQKFGLHNLNYLHSNIALYSQKQKNMIPSAQVVVSNSLLHHIHDPNDFWNALKNISCKGTVHYHRDLKRPNSPEEVICIQKKYLPQAPKILIDDYIASLHAAFDIDEIKSQLHFAGLKRFKVFEVGERYLEVVGIF